MSEVDDHAEPVHLAHDLLAERRQPVVRGDIGRRCRPTPASCNASASCSARPGRRTGAARRGCRRSNARLPCRSARRSCRRFIARSTSAEVVASCMSSGWRATSRLSTSICSSVCGDRLRLGLVADDEDRPELRSEMALAQTGRSVCMGPGVCRAGAGPLVSAKSKSAMHVAVAARGIARARRCAHPTPGPPSGRPAPPAPAPPGHRREPLAGPAPGRPSSSVSFAPLYPLGQRHCGRRGALFRAVDHEGEDIAVLTPRPAQLRDAAELSAEHSRQAGQASSSCTANRRNPPCARRWIPHPLPRHRPPPRFACARGREIRSQRSSRARASTRDAGARRSDPPATTRETRRCPPPRSAWWRRTATRSGRARRPARPVPDPRTSRRHRRAVVRSLRLVTKREPLIANTKPSGTSLAPPAKALGLLQAVKGRVDLDRAERARCMLQLAPLRQSGRIENAPAPRRDRPNRQFRS